MFELFVCDSNNVSVLLPFQWPYGDICGIGPVGKGQGTEFNLTFRKGSGKKSETLKFSTEHRTELLTEALVRTRLHTADNDLTVTQQCSLNTFDEMVSEVVCDVVYPCSLVVS